MVEVVVDRSVGRHALRHHLQRDSVQSRVFPAGVVDEVVAMDEIKDARTEPVRYRHVESPGRGDGSCILWPHAISASSFPCGTRREPPILLAPRRVTRAARVPLALQFTQLARLLDKRRHEWPSYLEIGQEQPLRRRDRLADVAVTIIAKPYQGASAQRPPC